MEDIARFDHVLLSFSYFAGNRQMPQIQYKDIPIGARSRSSKAKNNLRVMAIITTPATHCLVSYSAPVECALTR